MLESRVTDTVHDPADDADSTTPEREHPAVPDEDNEYE